MDELAVTSLEGSISSFQSYFNEATGNPRFLALVSPTCGPCLQGATAVREGVVDVFQDAGASVSLIWIPMLPGGSSAAIEQAAAEFSRDGMQQITDPERSVGRLVVDSLGGSNSIAWDIYLFYGPDARWGDKLPEPTKWVHQLGGYSWASPGRYRYGNDLTEELGRLAKQAVHHSNDGVRP